mmetsp:Transcript_61102/g.126132  ORF Transcript_61102/g.126132 Transcript_61102/m.126132 type:complete len:292 (+) Transcript_61102:1114-1989(+)
MQLLLQNDQYFAESRIVYHVHWPSVETQHDKLYLHQPCQLCHRMVLETLRTHDVTMVVLVVDLTLPAIWKDQAHLLRRACLSLCVVVPGLELLLSRVLSANCFFEIQVWQTQHFDPKIKAQWVSQLHVRKLARALLLLLLLLLIFASSHHIVGQPLCNLLHNAAQQCAKYFDPLVAVHLLQAPETVYVLALLSQNRLAAPLSDDVLPGCFCELQRNVSGLEQRFVAQMKHLLHHPREFRQLYPVFLAALNLRYQALELTAARHHQLRLAFHCCLELSHAELAILVNVDRVK